MDSESLRNHYHQPHLIRSILAALVEGGLDPDHLGREDLVGCDEFHIRGREATVELATLAGVEAGHRVLDLGCGIGGPARLLAAEYGCRVTGLDLIPGYCEAAAELTRRVGLSDLVDFQAGDMRDMPFADESFDRVWSQHTMMNIPDKAALAAEVKRVLRAGGKFVFYEVCAGSGEPVHLPAPWASDPGDSHLVGASGLRQHLTEAGLREEHWQDRTVEAIAWLDNPVPRKPGAARRPGLGLLMGPSAREKGRNLARNLRENRITVVQGVYIA